MSELVIHVGTHKTGSTSFQDTMFANRQVLADNGLDYPAIGPNRGHHSLVAVWSPNLPKPMRVPDVEQEWKDQTDTWRKSPNQVLISSEEFSRIDSRGLADLRKRVSGFDRVRILMVLRDQAGFMQSVYQEISDSRQPGAAPGWIRWSLENGKVDGLSFDYDELYLRFAKHFGAENIEVVSFAEARESEAGLTAYLLNRVGYDGAPVPEVRSNVSPKPLVTFLANALAQPGVAPQALIRQLDEFVTNLADGRKTLLFSKAEVQRIANAVAAPNRALEKRLGLDPGALRLTPSIPDTTVLHPGNLPTTFWTTLAVFLYRRGNIGSSKSAASPGKPKPVARRSAKPAGRPRSAKPMGASQDPWFLSNVEGKARAQFPNVHVPSLPDAETQRRFNGRVGARNLLQAFRFWQIARSSMEPGPDTKVLDFGCGWGRVGRFWLRDLQPEQIYLTDVMADAVQLVKDTGNPAHVALCDPAPPLPWDVNFDVIHAYSVFSHLNEDLFMSWMAEFHRRLKPGGQVVFTSRGERFIQAVRKWQDGGRKQKLNAAMMPTWKELELRYASGDFMFFTEDGGGDELDSGFYGQAFAPEAFVIEAAMKIGFKDAERIAEPKEIDQAIFRLTR